MDNLVIEHKDKLKTSVGYGFTVVVLAAILIVAAGRITMSAGTLILIAALAIEIAMTAMTLVEAFTKETFAPDGITVQNVFGSKTYLWKDLERFEVLWDYERKQLKKKMEVDAPYILLKFANPAKKLRFDYMEFIDQYIRANYGEPHVDDWTYREK